MESLPRLLTALAAGCAGGVGTFFAVPIFAALWRGEGVPGVVEAARGGADSSDDDTESALNKLRRRRAAAGTLVRRSIFSNPHAGVKVYNDGAAALLVGPIAAVATATATWCVGPDAWSPCAVALLAVAGVLGRLAR